jgi:hypothetical protein
MEKRWTVSPQDFQSFGYAAEPCGNKCGNRGKFIVAYDAQSCSKTDMLPFRMVEIDYMVLTASECMWKMRKPHGN